MINLFSNIRIEKNYGYLFLIYSFIFCLSFYSSYAVAAGNQTPSKSLIHGVPYISWNEAMKINYTNKDTVNPSRIASMGMILEYWGSDIQALTKKVDPFNKWKVVVKPVNNFNELKTYIARGMPVYVSLALTSKAHPYYSMYAVMLGGGMVKKQIDSPDHGNCSWMSGIMAPLEWYPKFHEASGLSYNPLYEILLLSPRVVIGYDDIRKVVILHDPTFGPALEVDYMTFDYMWQAQDRKYGVLYPKDHAKKLKKYKSKQSYRQRTPNEQAAFYLLEGCSLSVAGEYNKAEEYINKGLKLQGVSNGYQHILLVELALHQAKRGAYQQAIETTQKAIELFPDNYFPWEMLVNFYKCCGDTQNTKKAKHAKKKANSLKNSNRASKKVSRLLPSDYWIPALGETRGWGYTESAESDEEDSHSYFE